MMNELSPKFLRSWLTWFSLTLAVVTALILPLILQYEDERLLAIKEQESGTLIRAEQLVNSLFQERLGDIRLLAESPTIRRFLNDGNESARAESASVLKAFCTAYGQYDQLRIIGPDGQELIRVDYDEGQCREVSRAELQNKSDRYYFKESLTLAAGEVFVSPLDLNVEQGKVEVPHKPVIRFAMPVIDPTGTLQAVVVSNYRARHTLDQLFPRQDTGQGAVSDNVSFLLDYQGYYLKSPASTEREFAFMFNREQDRFSLDYPAVWQAIQNNETTVSTRHGLFLIKPLPVPVSLPSVTSPDGDDTPDPTHWYAVRLVTDTRLLHASILYGRYNWLIGGIYLLALAYISLLWTAFKQRRDEMISSGQMVKALFDMTPAGIICVDETGLIVTANARTCQMFGYQRDELLGQSVDILVPQKNRHAHVGARASYMRHPDNREMSMRSDLCGQRKDGSEFPVNISLSPAAGKHGNLVICSILDVTRRKSAEEQRQLALNMIEKSNDCFYHVDLDDGIRLIDFNEATRSHFGASRETMTGWHLPDWAPNCNEQSVHPLIEQIKGADHMLLESTHRLANGNIVPVEVSVNHYTDANGRNFAYGWFRDISERQEVARLQQEARNSAEAANQAKTDFIANISHEIRTPLNSVIGLTDMLERRKDINDEVCQEIGRIKVAGKLLLALINDVLDYSKIEAGEINLEMAPVQLEAVLADIESLMRPIAEQKGLELTFSGLPAEASGHVIGDSTRLQQVFLNLISNAIKFTRSGHVTLTVELAEKATASDDGQQQQRLRFVVEDTGIGIPPDVLPRLFRPFQQADNSVTRNFGGTGLGLVIVRQLCEEMGGSVTVASTPGKGSRFTVELPLRIVSDHDMQEAGFGRQRLRVLLADDNPADREVLVAMCQSLGWQVDSVGGGKELLARYNELEQAGQPVDCLIIDWMMPELDGLKALQRLHQTHAPEQLPGSLMITGHEVERLQRSPLSNLPDAILTKPIDMSELFNQVNAAFQNHFNDVNYLLSSSEINQDQLDWLHGVRVLVVDDSPMNLYVVTQMLTNEGATVSTCENGAEALAWLQTAGHHVDLVLMDIQMPVMDGTAAVREIRRIDALKQLPVVALTASAMASEHQKALRAGMNDYLTKPVERDRLVHAVRRYVEASRGKPVPVVTKTNRQDPARTWPSLEGIDVNQARAQAGNDVAMFMRLLRHFINNNRDLEQPASMPSNEQARDDLRARIHKFVGSAGVIGADAARRLARNIEMDLCDNRLEHMPGQLAELAEHYRRLQQAITPVLQQYEEEPQGSAREVPPLARETLAELREALERNRFAAVELYQQLAPSLRQQLPADRFRTLDEAMAKMDFARAIELLPTR
ncbi:response regulator [Marinobacter mobilis]|uniref:histidine kinase n=1 Tax=Marinobacter mobilis TaxID=488533 RepID=A0A1H2WIS9_9GAMM|nr:response regulator [Marinobacter mobilis]SDW79929.1 PAS domain S-box-containing protein [Marinobacter mobilis]